LYSLALKYSLSYDRLVRGSPYGFGNSSVMAEMDEISHEKAMKLIGGNA